MITARSQKAVYLSGCQYYVVSLQTFGKVQYLRFRTHFLSLQPSEAPNLNDQGYDNVLPDRATAHVKRAVTDQCWSSFERCPYHNLATAPITLTAFS